MQILTNARYTSHTIARFRLPLGLFGEATALSKPLITWNIRMDDRIHFPSSELCGGGKRKRKLAITGAIYVETCPQSNRNPSLLRLEHFEHPIHKVEQDRQVHREL